MIEENRQYGTMPKWVWNVSLEEIEFEEVRRQFKGFSEKDGYTGVMIVLWNNGGYMSEEYFEKYRCALEAAREFGLSIIIWDENGFPSGFAGGEIEQDYPQYTAKQLDMTELAAKGGQTVTAEAGEGFEGAVAMNTLTYERMDISGFAASGILKWTAPAGEWRVMLFNCVTAGQAQVAFRKAKIVDYLDREAVGKLIELTHQRYYDRFSEFFGEVIKYAFYDEPAFWHVDGGRIWTPKFKAKFAEKHGFSPVSLYPALWYNIGDDTAWARNLLFGFRAGLYASEYIGSLANWCHEHGILLTGHLDQEEIVNPVSISGDVIKVLGQADYPGVDEITLYRRGSCAYKLASSAAVNYDKERVMCEVYGDMGEHMPVEVLLKEGMDMLAKGINFFVPHGTWYSNDPSRINFPPELSFRSEKFAEPLAQYNEYAHRCCEILSGGQQIADIAVLYPIHDLQAQCYFGPGEAYKGGVNPEYSDYLELGEMLMLDARRDFVFIHPEILEERCAVRGAELHLDNQVNAQHFSAIIMPGMEAISIESLRKIAKFYDDGGRVLAFSRLPSSAVERGMDGEVRHLVSRIFGNGTNSNANCGKALYLPEYGAKELEDALENTGVCFDVRISTNDKIEGGCLSYIHKVKDGRDVYFISNSSDNAVKINVCLRGAKNPVLFDPHLNAGSDIDYTFDGEYTSFSLTLAAVKSVFVFSE